MCKTKLNAGGLNSDSLNSFTLLSARCDISDKVLNVHTEKIVLSICTLRLLSERTEDLDLKMELVSILYKMKLSDNPNVPTLFRGIGRALGKYLAVEDEVVADIIEERYTHETIVSEILTKGYALYEENHLNGMRLIDLLNKVRDMDYQDVLTTTQENGETGYIPKVIDRETYLQALDRLSGNK